MFTELTTEVVIFLIYVDKSEAEQFKKSHVKIPKDISEINVGDEIIYQKTINGAKADKTVMYMGKNTEGKSVLHMPGESYIYDMAIME